MLRTDSVISYYVMFSTDTATKGRVSVDEAVVEELVREFSANWKNGIQQINDDVTAYFANFRNGMEILKQVRHLLFYFMF